MTFVSKGQIFMLDKKNYIGLAFLALSSFAYADFSSGIKAYQQQEYKSAFDAWLLLANNQDSVAQYNIAKLYQFGQGVEEDYEEALKWFKKSFENGMHAAKKEIKLLEPTFLTKSEKEALEKSRLAKSEEEKKLIELERTRLAKLEEERLTELEKTRLAKLEKDRKARLAKFKEKQRLADLEKDQLIKPKKAILNKKDPYFEIHKNAILINDLAHKYIKEEDLDNRFKLPKNCVLSHQVKQDCRKVVDWYWHSANKGYAYAQYVLGLIYAQGMAHSENTKSAQYWFQQSNTSASQNIRKKSNKFLKLLQD